MRSDRQREFERLLKATITPPHLRDERDVEPPAAPIKRITQADIARAVAELRAKKAAGQK